MQRSDNIIARKRASERARQRVSGRQQSNLVEIEVLRDESKFILLVCSSLVGVTGFPHTTGRVERQTKVE